MSDDIEEKHESSLTSRIDNQTNSTATLQSDVVQPSTSRVVSNSSELSETKHSNDVFPIMKLPIPAFRYVLKSLRFADCVNLLEAMPTYELQGLLSEKKRMINRRIERYNNFSWTRKVGCYKWEHISNRMGHSMVYLESDHSVYIFGGGNLEQLEDLDDDEHASFNDLWKMNLGTMKCERVFVRSTPYPLPKYYAVMVPYEKYLVLHGGRQPLPGRILSRRFNSCTNEVHLFNPELRCWTRIHTTEDSPSLSGHCGVMHGDNLILYGGYLSFQEINTSFRVLNLKSKRWISPKLPNVAEKYDIDSYFRLPPGPNQFPCFEPASCSLIYIKPGLLLLLGELRLPVYSSSNGVLIYFDPDNIESTPWNWRNIKIKGKWWEERVHHQDQRNSSRPRNCSFPKVVAMYTDQAIRLITVGLPRKFSKESSSYLFNETDGRRRRLMSILDTIVSQVEHEVDEAYEKNVMEDKIEKTDFHLLVDGLSVIVVNGLLRRDRLKKSAMRNKLTTLSDIKVQIYADPNHPSQKLCDFDDGDLFDLKRTIFQEFERCHASHFRNPPFASIPRYLCYHSFTGKPKLVSYSALISLSQDFDKLEEITYIAGEPSFRGSPPGFRFELCATKDEVILQGGAALNGVDISKLPSFMYVMTPAPFIIESQANEE